jgi:serine/threonine protein kinase
VDHRHVCTIYAVEEQDGLPLIAMQYLEGRTLAQVITDGLTRTTARTLALQIASGLAAAHAERVVHGDLKPANVIVSADGTATILDFGLAGQQHTVENGTSETDRSNQQGTAGGESDRLTDLDETLEYPSPGPRATGGIRGTPAYMSPEQAAGKRPVAASDVFAFGLTWFEMLTGRPALSASSVINLLQQLRTEDLGPVLAEQVEPRERELLSEMLHRDPSRRLAMSVVLDRLTAS